MPAADYYVVFLIAVGFRAQLTAVRPKCVGVARAHISAVLGHAIAIPAAFIDFPVFCLQSLTKFAAGISVIPKNNKNEASQPGVAFTGIIFHMTMI